MNRTKYVSSSKVDTAGSKVEIGCRTGAMQKILWPWVDLAKREVTLPPGIVKNRKPPILPLSCELVVLLKKKFQTSGPVFNMKNLKA